MLNRSPRALISGALLLATVGALAASGSTNKAEKVDSKDKTENTGTGADASKDFKVGDEVKLGDWTVTVHEFKDPYPSTNEFLSPDKGNRFILVDAEVKNTSAKPETDSSLLCFKLQDSKSRKYDEALGGAGQTPGPPEGEVGPNESARGNIVFEIPEDAKGLALKFKCDLLSDGTATILLKK